MLLGFDWDDEFEPFITVDYLVELVDDPVGLGNVNVVDFAGLF